MPYYRVTVRGDPARGAGLLARAGIQSLVAVQSTSPEGAADDAPVLMARVSANDGDDAVRRVRAALEGQPFSVEDDAQQEQAE